jgi:hypothetical protein
MVGFGVGEPAAYVGKCVGDIVGEVVGEGVGCLEGFDVG